MMKVKYDGWLVFSDSGTAYRSWVFTEAVPELEAEKGDHLFDHGPGDEDERLEVRKDPKTATFFDMEEVTEHAFGGSALPPWTPPRPGERMIEKALKGVSEEIKTFRTDLRMAFEQLGREKTAESKTGSQQKPSTPTKENRYLRLKFDGEYDNGDHYKDFELLVDVPEIPADRSDVEPRHAIKGDVLRERYDDESTPFELRRNSKRIGDPEWWQVRHLFAGLKDGVEEDAEPDPPPVLRLLGDCKHIRGAYLVTHDIPEVEIREGDLLVHAWSPENFPDMRGCVRYLSIEDYAKLKAAAFDSYRETFVPLVGRDLQRRSGTLGNTQQLPEYQWNQENLYEFLKMPQKWGKRLKVWHSRLAVVRALARSPVSVPIEASSDEVALFDLITDSGGRMPTDGEEVANG